MTKYAITIIIESTDANDGEILDKALQPSIDYGGNVIAAYVAPIVDEPLEDPEFVEPVAEADLTVTYPGTPRPQDGSWGWDYLAKEWVRIENP